MESQRIITLGLGCLALVVLLVVFVFTPNGWTLLPLLLMAFVILALSSRMKAIRCSEAVNSSGQDSTAGTNGDGSPASGSDEDLQPIRRANRIFGPIVAGMIIDLVDLATFGPMGQVLGLPIGAFAGYWMGTSLGLSRRAAALCAVAAGIYCTIPGTEFIPLATIVGACVRYRENGKQDLRR